MAYFAQLDPNGLVLTVVVVNDSDIGNPIGLEGEAIGLALLLSITGYPDWKQSSFTGAFRVRQAGIGYTYDSVRDAFIPPQPFPSWVMDEETVNWTAPIPKPEGRWFWDEDTLQWLAAD